MQKHKWWGEAFAKRRFSTWKLQAFGSYSTHLSMQKNLHGKDMNDKKKQIPLVFPRAAPLPCPFFFYLALLLSFLKQCMAPSGNCRTWGFFSKNKDPLLVSLVPSVFSSFPSLLSFTLLLSFLVHESFFELGRQASVVYRFAHAWGVLGFQNVSPSEKSRALILRDLPFVFVAQLLGVSLWVFFWESIPGLGWH